MKTFKAFALASLLMASPLSFASGSTPNGMVTDIVFFHGHTGILIKHTAMSDPDGCGRSDYFILPDTYFRFKEAYAALLAANLANKQVGFTVSGCMQGLPMIEHMWITKS